MEKTQIQSTDKLYVVTRQDLFPGAQIAQSIHAVVDFGIEHTEIYREWHRISNYICVLAAKNEQELIRLIERLDKKQIKYSIFKEPDFDNELTAIAIEPGNPSKRLCSSYPLALKDLSLRGEK